MLKQPHTCLSRSKQAACQCQQHQGGNTKSGQAATSETLRPLLRSSHRRAQSSESSQLICA